jgi:hypothetical protein
MAGTYGKYWDEKCIQGSGGETTGSIKCGEFPD